MVIMLQLSQSDDQSVNNLMGYQITKWDVLQSF